MALLNGKELAGKLQNAYSQILKKAPTPPTLAVILVGDHEPSKIYVNNKVKAAKKVGITSIVKELSSHITENQLIKEIKTLNETPNVDGILVQMPLPPHINPTQVTDTIDPSKDVDGFHPLNLGKLLRGETGGFVPCTPLGIQLLLHGAQIDPSGKEVLIVGRSSIVGKPLAALLMQKAKGANATVTVAHSGSPNLQMLCKRADILVAAIGKARAITKEMVKPGAVVVDVGISRVDGKLVGDVDFESVEKVASAITPVPGGVGPMTIAMLLYNTIRSYQRRVPECIDLTSLASFFP